MDRIDEIMTEAVQTSTITRITGAERSEIARLYEVATGWSMNPHCDACIVKACFVLNEYKQEKIKSYGKEENNKKRNGRRNGRN